MQLIKCHFTQPSSAEKEGIARGLSEPLKVASFTAPFFFEQRRVVRYRRTKWLAALSLVRFFMQVKKWT